MCRSLTGCTSRHPDVRGDRLDSKGHAAPESGLDVEPCPVLEVGRLQWRGALHRAPTVWRIALLLVFVAGLCHKAGYVSSLRNDMPRSGVPPSAIE